MAIYNNAVYLIIWYLKCLQNAFCHSIVSDICVTLTYGFLYLINGKTFIDPIKTFIYVYFTAKIILPNLSAFLLSDWKFCMLQCTRVWSWVSS